MAGFQSPNYTQVPNDLFEEHMGTMGEAELKVVMAIIRQTIGYHREKVRYSIAKLEQMTGLSRNGVKDGAEAAEARGLIERLNPNEQGSAEWGLVVTPSPSDPPHPVTPSPSPSDLQVGLNKDIKITEDEVKERTAKLVKLYQENIGVITPLMADILRNATIDYPIESWYDPAFQIAVKNNARSWNYIDAILDGWKRNGFGWKPEKKNGKGKLNANNQGSDKDEWYEQYQAKRTRAQQGAMELPT